MSLLTIAGIEAAGSALSYHGQLHDVFGGEDVAERIVDGGQRCAVQGCMGPIAPAAYLRQFR